MAGTSTIRIVNYAVNGSGVGHLTRLVAANRWIRRYAAHAGVRAEIYFLTSSEADGLLFAERFASFKIPSKTVVDETGIDKTTYLALAKQWVWHSLSLLRPDLLIVDTFPRGSFGELLSALDLVKRRAFVYRPLKDSFAERADFQAMLPLYDAILVPEHEADAPVRVPDGIRARVRHVGPVLVRERADMLPAAEVRRRLGVPDGRLLVYVTAGGGGDRGAAAQIGSVCDALAGDGDLHLVVGAGPLYRGPIIAGERITWLGNTIAAELMAGFDLAICPAGYNTFSELMFAGVPAIFLPQEKIADDQGARAARAQAAGAAILLGDRSAASLRAAVASYRDPAARAAASAAGRALLPHNQARRLAAEMLRLVLPEADVDAAEDAVDDGLLAASRDLDLELDRLFDVMRMLDGRADERPLPRGDAAQVASLAVDVCRAAAAANVPIAAALRVGSLFGRKLPSASPEERAAAIQKLFAALAPFDDWNGAAMLLRVFGVERELPSVVLAAEIASFLGRLRDRGDDLYRGLSYLSRAQNDGVSNGELLRAAAGAIS